jgi:hypothetical protein
MEDAVRLVFFPTVPGRRRRETSKGRSREREENSLVDSPFIAMMIVVVALLLVQP